MTYIKNENVLKEKNEIWDIIKIILVSILYAIIFTFGVSLVCGFKYEIVMTGSMTPSIPVHSMVVLEPTAYEDLKIGDIITYKSLSSTSKITYTHRIVEFAENGNVITKGDATGPNGLKENISKERYVGRVVYHSYSIGELIYFAKQNIVLVTVCMAVLLMWYVFS